ncbi:MAG: sensor histidine kinase [Lachnospiraceae bacterium]|nr:sensor histidine kinase [Lachnospiraceae bacterium]
MSSKKIRKSKEHPKPFHSTIMFVFSMLSIVSIVLVTLVLYRQFAGVSRDKTVESTKQLMEQTVENLEEYLTRMRNISDTAYYNAIKEVDIFSQASEIQDQLKLLYEANKNSVRSIAVYGQGGSLLMAEPLARQKEDPDVTKQSWYTNAVEKVENLHFSTPHIQNLFDDGSMKYYWVISLSRVVELTNQGKLQHGVILVDMDYSSISRMMKQINTTSSGQYYYLCDSRGEIIYHPRQIQIRDGIAAENSAEAAAYRDGVYEDRLDGETRQVVVETVSYTGWKLVGVIPESTLTRGLASLRYFLLLMVLVLIMILVWINRVISLRISRPIMKLNQSVTEYEAGQAPDIFIGGSLEVWHLGRSIQKSYEQIDHLMKEIVTEQSERRKSELAALQSQINPHFLYNTLDSIMWMVEGEQNEKASFMIDQLAKLLRLSLSGGHTIISVADEIRHATSYMNIQKARYKDAFTVRYDIAPEVKDCCTSKLILQPILENAVNYGIDPEDDIGEITVGGCLDGGRVILWVEDNGPGMPEEEAELVLTDTKRVQKKGSGIGLINIHHRMQILFGKEYGVRTDTGKEEGMKVSVIFPAVPFTEENRRRLES